MSNSNNNNNNTNNTVEFQIDKQLDDDSLEIITLFLESTKRSGGGEILSHKLDANKKQLTVNYKDREAKERILSKKELTINNFTLKPVEVLTEENCEKNNKVLIFKNFKPNIDKEAIQLYVEHIVLNNTVKSIIESKLIPNTFYIEFENNVDFNGVCKRRINRSKLFGFEISVLETYKTNSIVGRFENNVIQTIEYLELHFTNVHKSGVNPSSFAQVRLLKDGIYLVRFNDYETVKTVLEREHIILRNRFIPEEYLSFNLIDN